MVRLNLPERIDTDRLVLQRLRYEDAEEIFYSYASKPEATKYLAFPTHETVEDARRFVRYAVGAWNEGGEYVFGIRIKKSNQLVGSIGFINDNGKVHFGYCISPTYWNMGIATEACTSVLNTLKQQKEVYRIWTFIDSENVASARVLLKCGLVEEARLSKWFRFVNQGNQPKDCTLFKLNK